MSPVLPAHIHLWDSGWFPDLAMGMALQKRFPSLQHSPATSRWRTVKRRFGPRSAIGRMKEHQGSLGGAPSVGMPLCLKWDARAEVQETAGAGPPRLHQMTQVYQVQQPPCAPGLEAAGEPKPSPPSLEGQAVCGEWQPAGTEAQASEGRQRGVSVRGSWCQPPNGWQCPLGSDAACNTSLAWLWAGICQSPQQGVSAHQLLTLVPNTLATTVSGS